MAVPTKVRGSAAAGLRGLWILMPPGA